MSADMAFVVLPDSDAGRAALARAAAPGPERIPHASGRPWLVGHWPADAMTVGAAGRTRLVVAGFCPVAPAELHAEAARLTDVAGLDDLARRLRGSAHLIASVGGRVRVQGGIAGVCCVYRARLAGVTVAADRPDTLAAMTGAHVDERLLALRLLRPCVPHPLRERALWRGVDAVPPGSHLVIEPDGTARTARWWQPPEPVQPLQQGASAVREALTDAVRSRIRATDGVVSTDLSGGMDSGILAQLAATPDRRLVTVRRPRPAAGGDDALWARRIADGLPHAEHLLPAYGQVPTLYAELDRGTGVLPAEPAHWIRDAARFVDSARRVAAQGSRLHLCGYGGDELFSPSSSYLHTLARSRPLTAVRHIRDRRALKHWPLAATWRAVTDSKDFPAWLTHSAGRLTAAPPRPFRPQLGWTPELRMPAWVTADAAYTTCELLTDASYEPLAPDRGTHRTLEAIRQAGAAVAYATRLMAAHGVRLAAPYLDDRVIEAALAVRPDERGTPQRYKPLLAEAMRGIVPDDLLGRATKVRPYGEDVMDGFRRHRPALLALFDGSELSRLGLVDDAAVRAELSAPHPTAAPLLALEPTLACEVWLRTPAVARSEPGAVMRALPSG
ncbi:asparagine synthase-related protein [Streptomyces sp. NPDC053079]|uniref:asparagine synthase-related protein n=1 Tax=Streptomyces sp. NPDC053079 TaxID=3365697 RepID=UPI0037D1157C